MKAAVIDTPDALPHVGDIPEPIAGENEVVVQVRAAGLHPIVKALASGAHYHNQHKSPIVCGVDGVGTLENGAHVYFGGFRGTMAEKAVANRVWAIPIPDGLDDVQAAALLNPAMSSWLALANRAQIQLGESVLILGATGVAGKLAVQIAKHLGAGKVIAAGRNETILKTLPALGADALVSLGQSDQEIVKAFNSAISLQAIDIVLDFVWGHPAELLLDALTSHDMTAEWHRTRFIQIGDIAGPTITFPAAALRSTGIEMIGSGGGSVPFKVIFDTIPQLLALAATGELQIETEAIPLADIDKAWARGETQGRRLVIIPA